MAGPDPGQRSISPISSTGTKWRRRTLAAFEQPQLFVEEIRKWMREMT